MRWATPWLAVLVLAAVAAGCSSAHAALPPPCSLITNSQAAAILRGPVVGHPGTGGPPPGSSLTCTFSLPGPRTLNVQEQRNGNGPGNTTLVVDGVTAKWWSPPGSGPAAEGAPHYLSFIDPAGNFILISIWGVANPQTLAKQAMIDILQHT